MLNNYNNQNIPQYGFKSLLSAPKGCLAIYDHQSYIQIAEGLILISKFIFEDEQLPQTTSYALYDTQSIILDLTVCSNGKILILVQNKMKNYQINVYTDGQPTRHKIQSKSTIFVKSYQYDNEVCYIFQSSSQDFFTQIIWFESNLKKIKASGILTQKVQFCQIDDQKIHFLIKAKIQSYFPQNKCLSLNEHKYVQDKMIGFVDLSDRLAIYSSKKINITLKDGKVCQVIELSDIMKVVSVTLGFIVHCESAIYHFQRRGDIFIKMDKFSLKKKYYSFQLSRKQHLALLQSQNGLVDVLEINNNRIDQNDNKRSFGKMTEVRRQQKHISLITVSSESNPFLLIIKEELNQIHIFSKLTLERVLIYKIDITPIYDCKIESNRPYFLLSAGGFLKKYYVLYDRIQESMQINLRPKKLQYSPNNKYVACLLGILTYSKVQLISGDNLKDIATLWVGQQVINIVWSDDNSNIFVIVQKGYQKWSSIDSFSQKKQFSLQHKIISANYCNNKQQLLIFTDDMMINTIKNQQIISTVKMQNTTSIAFHDNILFSTSNKGILSYNFIDSKQPSMQIKLFSGAFNIVGIYNNHILCMSSNRTTIFVLKEKQKNKEQNKSILSQQKDVTFVQRSFIKGIVKKQKHHEQKSLLVYEQMQDTVKQIQKQYQTSLNYQKKLFSHQIKQIQNTLQDEIQNNKNLEREVKQNKQKYQNQQLRGLAQLEKMYDRKITLLTNKLMTETQICYRNTLQSNQQIQNIQQQHAKQVNTMNLNFENKILQLQKMDINQKQKNEKIVKQYQQRLVQQYQQSDNLVKSLQFKYQQIVDNEKRIAFTWQQKYKKCMIDKFNIQQSIEKLKQENQQVLKNSKRLQQSITSEKKRNIQIYQQVDKLSKYIKDLELQLDRQRANSFQLSQANQVLSFKILESRQAILPKQRKLEQLKQKFCSFQMEYQKALEQISDKGQLIQQLKKENGFCKKQITTVKDIQQKDHRNLINLIYQIRQIVTETPTQDWNKKISLVYQDINKRGLFPNEVKNVRRNKKTIIQQIDRSKNHLEMCLHQVVTSNTKIQKRKTNELLKKLKQNADLLQQINQLRTKLKKYQQMDLFNEKGATISRRHRSFNRQSNKQSVEIYPRISTEVIQEQKDQSEYIENNTSTKQKKQQSKGFQSTSVDFRRSSVKKSSDIARSTIRKGGIVQISKMKKSLPQNEQLQFLYRKVQLQQKIIVSLRAKLNGISL